MSGFDWDNPLQSLMTFANPQGNNVPWSIARPQNTEGFMGSLATIPGTGNQLGRLPGSQGGRSGGWLTMDSFFGTKDQPGWGGLALGGLGGLGNAWMGMQQYGLAKDQLAEAKRQYNTNLEMQRSDINRRLEDRQSRRVEERAGATPVDEYMKKHGV